MCCHESKDHNCTNQSHHNHDECCCQKERTFSSRSEEISWLEQQRDELRKTLAALDIQITALQAESLFDPADGEVK